MDGHRHGGSLVFNVSLQGTVLCLKDSDCGSLEFCCPDGMNGSRCCERSASVRALWIMGVFLFIAIVLCLAILVRSRTSYLRCERRGTGNASSQSPTGGGGGGGAWSPVLTTLRELPPPYSTKPLSARELLTLQRQAMRYRAAAQQTLAPVTESMLAEFEQWTVDDDQEQHQRRHTLPCYHDVAMPIMEEPGAVQRVSPVPTLDEDELVYQSDSPSDDSEVEQNRRQHFKYASCATVTRHSRFKLARVAPKALSQSHDGSTGRFTHKPAVAASTAKTTVDLGDRPCYLYQSMSPLPISSNAPGSPPPLGDDCVAVFALAQTPRPPRRNRSWSASTMPVPMQSSMAVEVPSDADVLPSRPHTSIGYAPGTVPPDYYLSHGRQGSYDFFV